MRGVQLALEISGMIFSHRIEVGVGDGVARGAIGRRDTQLSCPAGEYDITGAGVSCIRGGASGVRRGRGCRRGGERVRVGWDGISTAAEVALILAQLCTKALARREHVSGV